MVSNLHQITLQLHVTTLR